MEMEIEMSVLYTHLIITYRLTQNEILIDSSHPLAFCFPFFLGFWSYKGNYRLELEEIGTDEKLIKFKYILYLPNLSECQSLDIL
jgi:hypothetical protein